MIVPLKGKIAIGLVLILGSGFLGYDYGSSKVLAQWNDDKTSWERAKVMALNEKLLKIRELEGSINTLEVSLSDSLIAFNSIKKTHSKEIKSYVETLSEIERDRTILSGDGLRLYNSIRSGGYDTSMP